MMWTMCMLTLAMCAVDIVHAVDYVYAVANDAGMYIAICIYIPTCHGLCVFWHVHCYMYRQVRCCVLCVCCKK